MQKTEEFKRKIEKYQLRKDRKKTVDVLMGVFESVKEDLENEDQKILHETLLVEEGIVLNEY